MYKKIHCKLLGLVTGIVCLFVVSAPVYAESIKIAIDIDVSVIIEPDHTLPFQYVSEKNGYLWKPDVPFEGVPEDQVAPLSGSSWVPIGIWGSVSGKNPAEIEDELASLGDLNNFASDSLAVNFNLDEFEQNESTMIDWSSYDTLLQEVKSQGRKVFVVIRPNPPPVWFDEELLSYYPPGPEVDPHCEISNRISYVVPEAKTQINALIETVVSRYAVGGQQASLGTAIAGWILDLNGGYVDSQKGTYIGYEQYSIDEFRYWLEAEYDYDIERLNDRWIRDNQETPGYLPNYKQDDLDGNGQPDGYSEFTEVDMPTPFDDTGEFIAGDKASWYDLVRWREDTFAEWVRGIVKTIKDVDFDPLCLKEEGENRHLISIVSFGEEPGDKKWRYSGIDIQKIAELCSPENNEEDVLLDFWSIVCNPSVEEDSEAVSSQWQLVRARARTNLPVMVLQLEVESDDEEVQKRILKSNTWEFIYGGAVGVHVYDGQDTIDITSAPYAAVNEILGDMAALTMDITNQQDEIVAQMGLTEYLLESEPAVPEVGLLETEAQHTVFNSFEAEIYSLYGPLKRLGFQPGFIDEETFIYDIYNINNIYNSIILPQSKKLSDDVFWLDEEHLFSRLRDVLDADMKLLANAELPGLMDDYGKVRHTPQPEGELWSSWRTNIEEIFGVDANSGKVDDLIAVNSDDILAYFPNNSPSLIANQNSAMSLYSLSESNEWSWSERYDWLKLIYTNEEAFGLEPVISVSNSPYVWMDYRTGPFDSVLVYLHNYVNVLQTIELKSDLLLNKKITLLLSGDVLSDYTETNKIGINVGPQDEMFLLATLASPPLPDDGGPGTEGDSDTSDDSSSGDYTGDTSTTSDSGSTGSSTVTGGTTGSSETATHGTTASTSTGTETGQEAGTATSGGYGSYSVIILGDNELKTVPQQQQPIIVSSPAQTLDRGPFIRTTRGNGDVAAERDTEMSSRVIESSEDRELSAPVFRSNIESPSYERPHLQTARLETKEPVTYVSYPTRETQFKSEPPPAATKQAVESTIVKEDPLVRYISKVVQQVIDFIGNLGSEKNKSSADISLVQKVSKYLIGMIDFSVPNIYKKSISK